MQNNSEMDYIILRPHHFLCIPGYRGHGYSREFEANMEKVIKKLRQGKKVKITLGQDDICSHCLKPANNLCSYSYTAELDSKVMSLLKVQEGEIVDFKEKSGKLKEIMTPSIHMQVCQKCIWMKKGFCSDTFI